MKVRKRGAWAMLLLLFTLTAKTPGSTAGREDIVHSFGYISMKDGAQISYTLHRPSAHGRFPTLLVYNMYDASAVVPNWNQTVSTEVADYLEEGFAVMGANVRGTACSSGSLDPLDAEQVGRDGAEVVEWIARQPWSDGAVGMFGHSGSGITQFYVAARNPAPLKAVIPGAAPADLYRDIGYPGGLFNYTFMYQWSERAQPAQSEHAARIHIESGDRDCAERLRNRQPNTTFKELRSRPLDDDWYKRHSVYSVASRINVPAFVVFGWQDQSVLSGAIRVFDQLQGPKKMLLAEEGHNFYIRSIELRREKIRFFNRWLKGASPGAADGKPIKIWLSMRGSIESIPDRVLHVDRLPAPGTRWTELFLAKGNSLQSEPPGEGASAAYLYPSGSAFVYGGERYPHTPSELGGLTFRTKPFPRETLLLGPTVVRLYLASTHEDTSFLAVLNEVDPSGARRYLQRGYLKASMRELDPQASRQGSPVYRFKKSLPLRPGEVTALEIELHPTGSIIEAGNALELLVMAPMMVPEPFGQWGFMPLPMAINTIHMSPEYRSRVLLPFVDEQIPPRNNGIDD
jgi:uncharacterized protein